MMDPKARFWDPLNVRISIFLFSNIQRKCNFPPHIRVIYMLMRWDKFDATKMKFGLHLPQLTHESKICCCTFSSKPPYRIYLHIIWTFNLHPNLRNWGSFLTKMSGSANPNFLKALQLHVEKNQVWQIQFIKQNIFIGNYWNDSTTFC